MHPAGFRNSLSLLYRFYIFRGFLTFLLLSLVPFLTLLQIPVWAEDCPVRSFSSVLPIDILKNRLANDKNSTENKSEIGHDKTTSPPDALTYFEGTQYYDLKNYSLALQVFTGPHSQKEQPELSLFYEGLIHYRHYASLGENKDDGEKKGLEKFIQVAEQGFLPAARLLGLHYLTLHKEMLENNHLEKAKEFYKIATDYLLLANADRNPKNGEKRCYSYPSQRDLEQDQKNEVTPRVFRDPIASIALANLGSNKQKDHVTRLVANLGRPDNAGFLNSYLEGLSQTCIKEILEEIISACTYLIGRLEDSGLYSWSKKEQKYVLIKDRGIETYQTISRDIAARLNIAQSPVPSKQRRRRQRTRHKREVQREQSKFSQTTQSETISETLEMPSVPQAPQMIVPVPFQALHPGPYMVPSSYMASNPYMPPFPYAVNPYMVPYPYVVPFFGSQPIGLMNFGTQGILK